MEENEMVYECACGGAQFMLGMNGQVVCADCDYTINDIVVTFPDGIPSFSSIDREDGVIEKDFGA